jgi:hypothetical protein
MTFHLAATVTDVLTAALASDVHADVAFQAVA